MKRFLRALIVAALAIAPLPAFAQSSATPVMPGHLVTSGCPTGLTSCYVPFDTGSGTATANTLRTTPATGGSGSNVTVTNLPTTVDTNTGSASASTLRVVLATGGGGETVNVSNLPTTVDTNSGASSASTLRVQQALPTAIISFQAKIAVTGTAVQLASNALVIGVSCFAKGANAASIEIGPSGVTNTVDGTGNGDIIPAGAARSFAVSNSNALYINGTAGDIVSCSGN